MTQPSTRQHSGIASARILSPDVARGLALFGIAAANIPTAWAGYEQITENTYFGGIQPGATGLQLFLDQITMVLGAMFAHVRGLPMFTTLVGFGIGLISLSLQKRDFPRGAARKTLIRRYGFLALFGAIHCVFLFYGDIMMFYGVLAIILALMIGLSNRTLKIIAIVIFAIGAVAGLVGATIGAMGFYDMSANFEVSRPQTYLGQVGLGSVIAVTTLIPVFSGIGLFPIMIVGFLFARSGVLQRPAEHLRTLYTWIAIGAAVVLLIGLPWGLSSIGVLNPDWAPAFLMLNSVFGQLTGPAIVSLVAVALIPLQKKYEESGVIPAWLVPVVALGKRSMSGYLFQSIVLFTLMLPFTFNLWVDVGAFGLVIIALCVWLASLAIAYAMERTGTPGPFEWLHRRLAYGKNGLPAHYSEVLARKNPPERPQG